VNDDVSITIVTVPETGFFVPGDVYDKGSSFIISARLAAAGGLSWSEFAELSASLMRLSVVFLERVGRMTGAEKKAAVLSLVGSLFDATADRCIPLVFYPFWLLARPAVRSLVLASAAGTMEQILVLVRRKAAA